MCVYSMIADHFIEKWAPVQPQTPAPYVVPPYTIPLQIEPVITPEEVAELKKLLERAREYDKRMQQPECELEEKKATLRRLAKHLGVELDLP